MKLFCLIITSEKSKEAGVSAELYTSCNTVDVPLGVYEKE